MSDRSATPDPSGTSMVERYWSLIHVPIVDADGEVVLRVQRAENITEFMGQRGLSPAELERSEVWRRRAQDVEADLYARAQELAVAVQAEQLASRRLSSFADVTMQLASADSVNEVADIVFGAGLPVVKACGGSIAVRSPDSDTLQVTVTPCLGGSMQRTYAEMPLHGPLPTSIAARVGQTILIPHERAATEFTGLPDALAMSATKAWAVLPLQVGARLLGLDRRRLRRAPGAPRRRGRALARAGFTVRSGARPAAGPRPRATRRPAGRPDRRDAPAQPADRPASQR